MSLYRFWSCAWKKKSFADCCFFFLSFARIFLMSVWVLVDFLRSNNRHILHSRMNMRMLCWSSRSWRVSFAAQVPRTQTKEPNEPKPHSKSSGRQASSSSSSGKKEMEKKCVLRREKKWVKTDWVTRLGSGCLWCNSIKERWLLSLHVFFVRVLYSEDLRPPIF